MLCDNKNCDDVCTPVTFAIIKSSLNFKFPDNNLAISFVLKCMEANFSSPLDIPTFLDIR